MLLSMKLHHGVVHPQQNLNVVGSFGGLSAGSSALVNTAFYALIQSLKIQQTAQISTYEKIQKLNSVN